MPSRTCEHDGHREPVLGVAEPAAQTSIQHAAAETADDKPDEAAAVLGQYAVQHVASALHGRHQQRAGRESVLRRERAELWQ